MRDLTKDPGSYDIVVGRGRISMAEIASLKRESIVLASDRQSGDPVDLFFNGQFISHGEVERIENLLMLRIAFNDWEPMAVPDVPVRDNITETIGFSIRLARVRGALADIRGIGEYGLINFGLGPGFEQQAELVVADQVVARGTVGFRDDSWALIIGEVEKGVESPREFYSTGAIPLFGKSLPRTYTWGHGDMFSRKQIKGSLNIHELFAQNLRELHPSSFHTHTHTIDQMQLSEAIEKVQAGYLYRIQSKASRHQTSNESQRHFAELSGSETKVDGEVAKILDEYARELDHAYALDDTLLYVDDSVDAADDGKLFLSALRNAWRTQARIPLLEIEQITKESVTDDSLRLSRMVLIATFLARPEDNPDIHIIYPAMNLLKIARGLR